MASGFLQINDVVLRDNVVPTSIHIDRQSYNHRWQTLRSRNTMKVKSGYSAVKIRIDASFVDPEGWAKLRLLVAQLKVTPFCYVENQEIRDAILEGKNRETMALALSSMHIRKSQMDTNVISATFNFLWFNYKPFTDMWKYRVAMFSDLAAAKPEDSFAWLVMYRAELERGNYALAPEALSDDIVFKFSEYLAPAVLPKKADEKDVNKFVEKYFELQKQVQKSAESNARGYSEFRQPIPVGQKDREQVYNLLGNGTSMELDLFSDLKGEYQGSEYSYKGLSWQPILSGSNYVTYGGKVLMRRESFLRTKDHGLNTVGIDISFSHNLAMMPIVGQSFATYQHIGSADAVINIQMMTTENTPLQKLANFYNSMEQAEIEFRNIPAQHRRIKVANDIANMLGVYDGIVEGMAIDTVPDAVGAYSINMTISDDPFLPTKEKLSQDFAFSTPELRAKLGRELLKHIKYFKKPSIERAMRRQGRSEVEILAQKAWRAIAGGKFGYQSLVTDDRSTKLRLCCEEYAEALNELYNDCSKVVSRNMTNTLAAGNPATEFLTFLLSWGDKQLPGIEQVQRDLSEYIVEPRIGNKDHASILPEPLQLFKNLPTLLQNSDSPETRKAMQERYEKLKKLRSEVLLLQSRQNKTSEERKRLQQASADYDETFRELKNEAQKEINKRVKHRQEKADALKKMHADRSLALDESVFGGGLASWTSDVSEQAQRLGYESWANSQGTSRYWFDLIQGHQKKIIRILDRWLARSILSEPALSSISKKVLESLSRHDQSSAYPDFPTKQIIAILRQSNADASEELVDLIFQIWNEKGYAAKDLGPNVMINPDFYLISSGQGMIGNLLETHAMKEIKETTRRSLQNFHTEHLNWIEKAGRRNASRRARIAKQRLESKSSFENMIGNFKDVFYGSNAQAIQGAMAQQSDYQTPYDFPDGTICYDAGTSTIMEGQPVSFEKLGDLDNDELALWVSQDRPQSRLEPNTEQISNDNRIAHEIDGVAYTDTSGASSPKKAPSSGKKDSTGKLPPPTKWVWPIDRRIGSGINSKFQWKRIDPVWRKANKSKYTTEVALRQAAEKARQIRTHLAIDLGARRGTPIRAIADGYVVDARLGWYEKRIVAAGYITIDHGNGWWSKYVHIAPDDLCLKWVAAKGKRPFVKQGEIIARVDTTGWSTGPHLHFAMFKGPKPSQSTAVDPVEVFSGAWIARSAILPGSANGEDLIDKMIGAYEADQLTSQGKGMARAYPTFKLYFIERDVNERREYGFDDFFSYAAVKEIQVIRHEDMPADVCLLQLTNISGTLSNRRFRSSIDPETHRVDFTRGVIGKEDPDSPENANTKKENELVSMLLQPGNEIQLRLGYSNSPPMLETVFNGKITEVQFSDTDDLVNITAQSYGTELAQRIYGQKKPEYLESGDTKQVLEQLLAKSELKHFGRWEPQSKGLGEYYDLLTERWQFKSRPVDINDFAPGGDQVFNPYKMDNQKYWMFRTTIWDVFKEMTLRHPGYIVTALPYEGEWGPRMTLYFGLPNQLYYARDPSHKENDFASVLGELSKKIDEHPDVDSIDRFANRLADANVLLNASELKKQLHKLQSTNVGAGVDYQQKIGRDKWFKFMKETFARKTGIVRPVRAYHLVTSRSHIIANNIAVSAKQTFNAVNLSYTETINASENRAEQLEEGKSQQKKPGLATRLINGDVDTLQMKGDSEIPDEDVREMFATYLTCVGKEQAKRYALSLVWNAMKRAYSGSLVIVGNPHIKPHDVVYICDTYSDMYGQVEAAQVIHKFSAQTGFVTEITPEMVIHINQTATMSTDEIMGLIAAEALGAMDLHTTADLLTKGLDYYKVAKKVSDTISENNPITAPFRWVKRQLDRTALGQLADTISENSLPLIGPNVALWLGRKYLGHSQYNHPLRFEPLVYRDMPLMQGIKQRGADGGFFYRAGKFFDEGEKGLSTAMSKLWDQYDPRRWLFGSDSRGNVWKWFANVDQGYTGPNTKPGG